MSDKPTREEILAVSAKIRPDIERVASTKGWLIIDNKDVADSVIEGLARNVIIYGKKYCPCRIHSDNEDENRRYICPCRDAVNDVEKDGHCHCYLYVKPDFTGF